MAHSQFQNIDGFPAAPAGSEDASIVRGPAPAVLIAHIGDEADRLPTLGAERLLAPAAR
jgi:hypothetical protein